MDDLLDILKDAGAYLEGHFLLTSGRHGDRFFLMSQAFQHPELATRLGAALAALFQDQRVDVVVGPAMGGVLLAHEVARALGARSLYAEKSEGAMELRRGFRVSKGERVLAVEDVVTTGGSVRKTLAAVAGSGADLVGVGALVDRSGGRAAFSVPFRAVAQATAHDWDPADCPLCVAGAALVRPKA